MFDAFFPQVFSILMKCGYEACTLDQCRFRCSRCKAVSYCSPEHQKLDWSAQHKRICQVIITSGKTNETIDNKPTKIDEFQQNETNSTSEPKRECRCMFCGQMLLLGSEDEAVNHMRECDALQKQLSGQSEFTLPKELDRFKK